MKKLLLVLIAFILLFVAVGCTKKENDDKNKEPIKKEYVLSGSDIVYVGEKIALSISNLDDGDKVAWASSDESIAKVTNGEVEGISEGEALIIATINDEEMINKRILVSIKEEKEEYALVGLASVNEGESITLEIENLLPTDKVEWLSRDSDIAEVNNGVVSGLKAGSTTIIAIINDEEILSKDIEVKEIEKPAIWIEGKSELVAGEMTVLAKKYSEEPFDVVWSSTNPSVAIVSDGEVLALKEGKTIIKATKASDSNVYAVFNLSVSKYESTGYAEEEINFAKEIVKNMSVDELIGQMLIGSYAGTSLSNDTINAIEEYKLGNFIFMGNNTPSGVEAASLATALQNKFISTLGIPGFISIDQETGRICRLTNGATRFLGNMASAATGDAHDRFLIGEAVGEELKTYGINFDLAPVLDVNNNPNNPVINNRSFSDNQMLVSLYGEEMMKGLMSEDVMACAKHFPGHGNTATDSHYGLPIINSSLDELYQIELAPFIHAIYSGIDAIMTTHILFTVLDSDYPATLSKKILTDLLRGDLGFDGLIVTDGMEMQAITNYYGAKQAPVLAVKAGADMLCYTTISGAVTAITAIKEAYNNNEITKDRLEESVMRIIMKKNKYHLFNNYLPKDGYATYDTTAHEELNLALAKKAVTVYKGDFSGLDKTKKTVIFSSKCSYQLKNYSGTNNSFGKYAVDYLKEKGMNDVDFVYISSITNSEVDSYVNSALEYEQIVVAISDANSAQVKFVNELAKKRNDIIVVALNLPYDLNSYNNVNTYICTFENTPIMVEALTYLMNGEYKPTGVSPVKLNK